MGFLHHDSMDGHLLSMDLPRTRLSRGSWFTLAETGGTSRTTGCRNALTRGRHNPQTDPSADDPFPGKSILRRRVSFGTAGKGPS